MPYEASIRPVQRAAAILLASGALLGAVAAHAGSATGPAPIDPELQELKQIWEAKRYAAALPRLVQFRKRGTGSAYRNETVDYMIGTSACRLPGQASLGRVVLQRMLYSYKLDAQGRKSVEDETRRCPPVAGAVVPVDLSLVREAATVTSRAAVSVVRGKMAYDPRTQESTEAGSENVAQLADTSVIRRLSQTELDRRLFEPGRATEAVAGVQRLAGPRFRVLREGPFVVASSTHTPEQMRALARGVNGHLRFYLRAFGMQPPPHLITIYLAADAAQIRDLAARVHGLRISPSSIGYSFPDDMSMIAIIPRDVYGTLMHELFHLVVRADFGDVPAWLDEGMAALFEVSRIDAAGAVRGVPNWRGPILMDDLASSPSVDELVRAEWPTFDALSQGARQQAINHATARYFALYLQEQGLLPTVYRAFRAQEVVDLSERPGDDAVRLLEAITGRSVAVLQSQFSAWLRTLPA